MKTLYCFILYTVITCTMSCTNFSSHPAVLNQSITDTSTSSTLPTAPPVVTPSLTEALHLFTLADFYSTKELLNQVVDSLFNRLSLTEKVGQLIIAGIGQDGEAERKVLQCIKQRKISGAVLLSKTKKDYPALIHSLQQTNQDISGVPLLLSLDAEPSLINYRIRKGIPKFPKTAALKTVDTTVIIAQNIVAILDTLGIHQNYAPVCDIAANKAVINNRSFGSDTTLVKMLTTAFIEETQANGIVATAKHFPGHGNVKGDSHHKLVYIDGKLAELGLFQQAIQSGVISVMTGHIAIKNNPIYNTNGRPASISRPIVTGLLKNKMGFKGLVITDGMVMGALKQFPNAEVEAIKAGSDLVLMPKDAIKLHRSLIQLMDEEIYQAQLIASIKKIVRLKVCLGLFQPKPIKEKQSI